MKCGVSTINTDKTKMKKLLLFALFIFAFEISFAQTASDYFLPMCVGNQAVLYANGSCESGYTGRNFTYTYLKTDTISGVTYFVEEGKEYLYCDQGTSVFAKRWLREDVNGNILLKKVVLDESDSLIFPSELIIFSNNFFTAGYSINQIVMAGYTITDSVISTNATFGNFTNCIQVREIDNEDTITGIEDIFYATGIGRVGGNRIFTMGGHSYTSHFGTAYITACDPIIDTLDPVNVVDTCLGPEIDYYVTNIQVDTNLNTVTVTWIFQDSTVTNQFIATYPYQNMGNNVISITLQCSKASTTYYKPIHISTSPLSINEAGTLSSITIYPNPAKDFITIDNNSDQVLEFNLYNIMGSLIKKETLTQNQKHLNISDLCNGIYFVEIKSKNMSKTQKLIIQR
jgi:hypothetical protein